MCLFLYLSFFSGFGQNLPSLTTKTEESVKLSHLDIKVNIIGNNAMTVFDMKFYNPNDQLLEGELSFPLQDGQSVAGFSMDVNGEMRDAIVIEKELARVAYESTIRQRIDPGLLEKTEGNNYKARIYPILAKQHKRIIITVEEELKSGKEGKTYALPLQISEPLERFNLEVNVNGETQPIIDSPKGTEEFIKRNGGFNLNLQKIVYPNSDWFKIRIPDVRNGHELLTDDGIFYYHQNIPPKSRLKKKPKDITILWDVSYSMKLRNLQKEIKLLSAYLEYLNNVEVHFISFSSQIQSRQTFQISNGDAKPLVEFIKAAAYDGGTALNLFDNKDFKADEVLLFSDGLSNLGKLNAIKHPVYAINSLVKSNSEYLNELARETIGATINLLNQSHEESLNLLQQETYQFLGVKHDKSIYEVYPCTKENVSGDFSISGKFKENSELSLLFGYNGKVTAKQKIRVVRTRQKAQDLEHLWAKKKLAHLERSNYSREDISKFAVRHQLISDYTSMLILDRVEDYARYRIEPPKELKEEYKQLVKEYELEEEELQEDLEYRKEELVLDYEDLLEWYNTSYPLKKKQKKNKQVNTSQAQNTTIQQPTQTAPRPRSGSLNEQPIDNSKRIITGSVLDENDLPLPSALVMVKGTDYGAQTNFDGEFILNAEEGDVLVFSYIGYLTKEIEVGASGNSITTSLSADSSSLDEVVVTGYGVSANYEVSSASSTVYAMNIEQAPNSSMSRSLQGQVAGLNVVNSNINAKQDATFDHDGQNDSVLYIINGEPSSRSEFKNIVSDSIQSIEVLKPSDAVKVFGNRAAQGTVVLNTKEGYTTNKAKIEEIESLIAKKIELIPRYKDKPYIKILEEYKDTQEAYVTYLELRDTYSNSPVFFIDVADFFDSRSSQELAVRVLSNLIELDINNHELLKALAYKLEYFQKFYLALEVYKKILELRPEEPQSYRDLALAYEQVGDHQKGFDLLYKLYDGQLLEKDEEERFYGIEHIAYVELCRLVALHKKELKVSKAVLETFPPIPVDIRVVIDWNHNDTDIDLWVTDPKAEKGYYSNSLTKIGGRISEDLTEGYGPEEYLLKEGIKGEYAIEVDYFADNVQKISGPTILKVTVFKNYGRKNEEKRVLISYLEEDEDDIKVGKINFK